MNKLKMKHLNELWKQIMYPKFKNEMNYAVSK